MTFIPRYYQTEAHDAIIEHARKSLESQVCVIPTGGGKSHIIASVAKKLHEMTGKKILCTAPSADLVLQNTKKYLSYGYYASVFCASARSKSLKHDVVFGSPLSLLNAKSRLAGFSAIIIDECDLITRTVRELIDHLRVDNPQLRVIGLTATPYRMGMGYIYAAHYKNGFVEDTYEPYFTKCTYEVGAHALIDCGYLTKPVLGKGRLQDETGGLVLKKTGKFDSGTVDQAFVGKGRLTSDIVADVVQTTAGYSGVLIFASTIAHAEEVLESLPPGLSGIVHSKLKTRKQTMLAFERREIKYLVNVDCLTVGIDWPHVDCIAMLRRTESSRLYQQIIGRGLRLDADKQHCLILDYAGNNPVHFPGGDVFNPKIRAVAPGEPERLPAICPDCGHENSFATRQNDAGYALNDNGYFVWPDTLDIVLDKELRPVPSHFGRRCFGLIGRTERCNYRWTFKSCDDERCTFENDIAARFCKCGKEIIDPNEKLELEEAADLRSKIERPLTEPIMGINIDDDFRGDSRIKVVTIKTIFDKKIMLFLSMVKQDQRELFRTLREPESADKNVKFYRPKDGKYYRFLSLC